MSYGFNSSIIRVNQRECPSETVDILFGAGDGIQTRGLILGKDALWSAELHPLIETLL